MGKRNRPSRPRNEAIWRKIADQGFYALLLAVFMALAIRDVASTEQRTMLVIGAFAALLLIGRISYLGYQLYLERHEPVRNNTNPVYKCPPLPGDSCPVCGRRLIAKLTHKGRPAPMYTWVCPGSRCGYEWRV